MSLYISHSLPARPAVAGIAVEDSILHRVVAVLAPLKPYAKHFLRIFSTIESSEADHAAPIIPRQKAQLVV